tara:strand:+ start:3291 stop:3533 length:243 start_codon:yes stop_codon:yes gene_type:complete
MIVTKQSYKQTEQMEELIYLKSVDSYLNQKKGIIYPALVNNKPDLDCPISLKEDEVSREWYSALSAVDMHHVNLVDILRL